MPEVSPESPEERRKRGDGARVLIDRAVVRMSPGGRAFEILKRVVVGVVNDGSVHAGNLAYLAILTLFPFFIVAAAIARIFGRSQESLQAVEAFLRAVPPGVAEVLRQPITDVLLARTGSLLWFGALVGLWTTASFIETIRDILRRAYGVRSSRPFWEYRLGSMGLIVGSVILLLAAFALQVAMVAVEQFVVRVFPFADDTASFISTLRIAPALALFAAMYLVFYTLTPSRYRSRRFPKWPGAAATSAWWVGVTAVLPWALSHLTSYDLTYGSLAGVTITLIFFWLIGLGVVLGAELNAALAEMPAARLEDATNEQGAGA